MNNREMLKVLNKKCKIIIDDCFSFINYFENNVNKMLIPDNDDSYMENVSDNVLAYSLLLSFLKNDDVISAFFKKYNINYDTIINLFDKNYFNDLLFLDASETKYLSDINLQAFLDSTLLKTKYTSYLEDKYILYDEIEPYQIFDYLFEVIEEAFSYIFKNELKLDENIYENLSRYLYDYYSDYAFCYGVNIEEEVEKECNSYEELDFNECEIYFDEDETYIYFKQNANLNNIIYHYTKNNSKLSDPNEDNKEAFIDSIILPKVFKVNSVYHKKPDKEYLESILLKPTKISKIPFEIEDLDTHTNEVIFIDKYYTFFDNNKYNENTNNSDNLDQDMKLYTPNLDKYGYDLTKDKYIKDPSIGRETDIRRIEQILCYPERDKSIIITGVAGSGKTALVKGLAYRIQNGDVPRSLKNLRIISVDAASLVAGCRYVGMLEERMKGILDEASQSKDIIIFMDEIHQALGAGKAENDPNSVSEILKPYLDYGRVRIIGATTTEEYNEYVSKDDAFKTRFKKVTIDEPNESIIYQILNDLIETYNNLSEKTDIFCPKLNLNDEKRDLIIKWLIDSTKAKYRSFNDRASNPRLVLDIIKEAYAIASINDQDEVTIENIKEALLLETRLYNSSKQRQIDILNNTLLLNNYNSYNNKIIDFSLVKKK